VLDVPYIFSQYETCYSEDRTYFLNDRWILFIVQVVENHDTHPTPHAPHTPSHQAAGTAGPILETGKRDTKIPEAMSESLENRQIHRKRAAI
jgi:hypothetical protein